MPLAGTLQADFSPFFEAVQKAEIELKSFETGAVKVESALSRMVDSFSGRRLIQDATLMIEAVERIGGVTKLTDEDMARLTRTVEGAKAKMVAMGVEVPAAFDNVITSAKQTETAFKAMDDARPLVKVGDHATGAMGKLGKLSGEVAKVDRILGLAGVSASQYGAALGELEVLASVAAGGMTVLTGGLLAAGAALLVVNTDWEKLDRTIADSTAKLFGWGDAAKEEAGAVQDLLDRASKIAGHSITTMAEAQRVMEDHANRFRKAAEDAYKRQLEIWKELDAAAKAQADTIRTAFDQMFGTPILDKMETTQAALSRFKTLGLEPIKAVWPEIVSQAKEAMQVLEDRGLNATDRFRTLAAIVKEFSDKLAQIPIASTRIPGAAGLITPTVGGGMGSQDQTAIVNATELANWLERATKEQQELDAEVRKFYELQGSVFDELTDGAAGATAAVDRLGNGIARTRAELEALARTMTQAQWLSGKPAGMSVTEYLETSGPALQALRAAGRGPMGAPTVIVNAQNSFFDTPTGQQRLAGKVSAALLSSSGR